MIQVWTGDKAEHLTETRRGNNLRRATKRIAADYDAEIRRCGDIAAVLRTTNGKPIVVMLCPDFYERAE